MSNIDIVVNGVRKTRIEAFGKLQSITCMKEYEGKSLEELHWEDHRAGRKGQAESSLKSLGDIEKETKTSQTTENEKEDAQEKSGKIGSSTILLKPFPLADDQHPLADHTIEKNGLAKTSLGTDGKDESDELDAAEDLVKRPTVPEIISIRPRLKGGKSKRV